MHIPPALVSLTAHLKELGFVCDADDASESFGDRVVMCDGPAFAVRMVCDRGQWFLEVGRVDWDEWFDVDVWRACIERAEVPRELPAQADYVALNIERLSSRLKRRARCSTAFAKREPPGRGVG